MFNNLTQLNVDFVYLACNGCGFDAFEIEFDVYDAFRNQDVTQE